MTSDLLAAYQRHKVVLWVEDAETVGYLREAWGDPDFGYMIAGNNDSVFAVVADAVKDGASNTFGFVDRDFRRGNRKHWITAPQHVAVYVPDAHEVECYAVDEVAAVSVHPNLNPANRDAAIVRSKAHAVAGSGTWWMALRALLSEVGATATKDFPRHPKVHQGGVPVVPDLAAAEAFVRDRLAAEWLPASRPAAELVTDGAAVRARLQELEASYAATLAGEDWRHVFSGHEMFDALATYVYLHTGGKKLDLLLAIGEAQRRLGRVPEELQELRLSLRRRVGLPDPVPPEAGNPP